MSAGSPALLTPGKWDRRFFALCDLLAAWSEDRHRHVGCVIVGPANEIRATGFNGFARGVDEAVERRWVREDGQKFFWSEHAERNAVYNAARAGVPLAGCRAYVNVFPCADCMRALIQSGIAELNTHPMPEADPFLGRSFDASLEMAREIGLTLRLFSPHDHVGHGR